MIRKINWISFFVLIVLLLSALRGGVPIVLDGMFSAQNIYYFISMLGVSLSLFGLFMSKKCLYVKTDLKKILYFNLAGYILWLIVDLAVEVRFESFVYFVNLAIVPFTVFMFSSVPEKYVVRSLAIISFVLSITTIYDFLLLNYFAGGVAHHEYYQSIIRPAIEDNLDHSGSIYRAAGLTGNLHDTGNLLAMLSTFWVGYYHPNKKVISSILFVPLTFIGLLATVSTSNILAAIFGILFVVIYKIRIHRIKIIAPIIIVIIFLIFSNIIFSQTYNIVSLMYAGFENKVTGKAGDWSAMLSFGFDNHISDIFSLLLGHGTVSGLSDVVFVTESALVKLFFESGFILGAVFLTIALYPMPKFFSLPLKNKKNILGYIGALSVGILSLWHYGSIFRSTNIYLFYLFYAMTLRLLYDGVESKKISRDYVCTITNRSDEPINID